MIPIRNLFLIVLCILALISLGLSLSLGSVFISPSDSFMALHGQKESALYQILLEIRLPRVLCAFITGGLLALAGVLMQALLKNPLADPSILGVSGGAGFGALLWMFIGGSMLGLTTAASIGSLLAFSLVIIFSRVRGSTSSHSMLLAGVALSSFFAALMSLILILSPDMQLKSMLFWLMGDLSSAHMPIFESLILLIGIAYSFVFAEHLNIFASGEEYALGLGVNTKRLRLQIYILSSLLTATAVTLGGCIGFIGLIIPHLFRFVCTYDHRYLIPGSVLLGGIVLTIADTVARCIIPSQELPVGMLTALIGIPVFIFFLRKQTL